MPEKQQYIEEIAEQTLKSLSKTDNWFNYLKSASHHYKYSFHESYLIHAQRPDATAVASYDQWNKQMHRFINAGAKGIALLDASGNNKGLKHVFDKVSADISDVFELEKTPQQFESTVEQIVDKIIEDNLPDMMQELISIKEDTFFEELDDDNIEIMLKTTLKESTLAMVLTRCGYEYEVLDFDFSRLHFLILQKVLYN